jgi:uncharacterized protein involved in response to NO
VAGLLVAGIVGGLLRAGVPLPAGHAAAAHAALMIGGFFGTVIAIERAVALRLRWAWLAPATSGAGAWALVIGAHDTGAALIATGAVVFCAASVEVVRRQRAAHTLTLLLAALCGAGAALQAWAGRGGDTVLIAWFAFLVLTIAAERLEMTRLMRRQPTAQAAFGGIVALLLAAVVAAPWAPHEGVATFGAALVLLAAWLGRFDVARITVRAAGLPRYMAVGLLAGYAWLGVGGVAWVAVALGGHGRDAALHAIGLGFVFSMVMAHAPVILPAVAGVKVRFGAAFYVPLALLHGSLLLRVAEGWADPRVLAVAAALNAAALALFALTLLHGALAWRHAPHATPPDAAPATGAAPSPAFTAAAPGPRPSALWALGFRPLYLLASIYAALSVPIWALQYAGWLGGMRAPAWHAHEMLFGYTLAVVVGFLFTAGRNWSGQATPTGRALMALALLWVAGRVLVYTPWTVAALSVNVAFPLAAAAGLARALVAGGNRRNYFLIAVLVSMAVAQGLLHAALAGWINASPSLGLQLGLDGVLFVMAVMGGRVIPMFSNGGAPGTDATRHAGLERLSLGAVLVIWAADALQLHGLPLAAVLALAALAHAARLALWHPWRTRRVPLVWVLHAAYAWIPLHLALRAAAEAGWIAASPATHALTAGAIGTLTLAMMTRTARGHTGRALQADRIDVSIYTLVLTGAALRVMVPLAWPQATLPGVLAAGALWSAAFALYAGRYGPWLWAPRVDGRAG